MSVGYNSRLQRRPMKSNLSPAVMSVQHVSEQQGMTALRVRLWRA